MVGLVHVRWWEKRNRHSFYWYVLEVSGMPLVWVESTQLGRVSKFCDGKL